MLTVGLAWREIYIKAGGVARARMSWRDVVAVCRAAQRRCGDVAKCRAAS
jgi:hypothetical protein